MEAGSRVFCNTHNKSQTGDNGGMAVNQRIGGQHMLTGKQKRYLRAEAHHLDPIFQVGKGGVNDHMIKSIGEALEVRELLKVSILTNNTDDKQEVADALVAGTGADLVQLIGKTVILYKESVNNKQIELPRK